MNYIESIFFKEFENIVFFFIICSSLSFIILFLSISITVSAPDPEKSSSYECGFDPYGDARNMFDVRFYLVAILFIVFDLESIYFFPWCTSFSFLNYNGFFSMLDFIIEYYQIFLID
jgi:NADH-quinone oxidoreductase subunit A